MDTKEEDKSEESKRNHIAYYQSLTRVIKQILSEKEEEEDPTIKNHLDARIDAMEKDKVRIKEMFPDISEGQWKGDNQEDIT